MILAVPGIAVQYEDDVLSILKFIWCCYEANCFAIDNLLVKLIN